jgi:hypothetical protein
VPRSSTCYSRNGSTFRDKRIPDGLKDVDASSKEKFSTVFIGCTFPRQMELDHRAWLVSNEVSRQPGAGCPNADCSSSADELFYQMKADAGSFGERILQEKWVKASFHHVLPCNCRHQTWKTPAMNACDAIVIGSGITDGRAAKDQTLLID